MRLQMLTVMVWIEVNIIYNIDNDEQLDKSAVK